MTTVVDYLCTSSASWYPTAIVRYKNINEVNMKEEGEEEEGEEGEEEEGEEGEEEENEKKGLKNERGVLSSMNNNSNGNSNGNDETDSESVEPLSVCAVDCEMCYTAAGLELTRVSNAIVVIVVVVFVVADCL